MEYLIENTIISTNSTCIGVCKDLCIGYCTDLCTARCDTFCSGKCSKVTCGAGIFWEPFSV